MREVYIYISKSESESLDDRNQIVKALGGTATCSEGFVNCFLKVPQAVGLLGLAMSNLIGPFVILILAASSCFLAPLAGHLQHGKSVFQPEFCPHEKT